MQIGGWQKLTLTDFPGRAACKVFVLGCNFRCPWCSRGDFVLADGVKEKRKGKDFFRFLKQQKNLLKGVVVSGGEPCLQKDLAHFCWKVKGLGFGVKIETNGSQPAVLEELIKRRLVDYLALDIKGPREKYCDLAGLDNSSASHLLETIEKSAAIIKESGLPHHFTTTFHCLLTKNDIFKIVQWLQPQRYFLQKFSCQKTLDPNFAVLEQHPISYIYQVKQAVSPWLEHCQIQ